MRLHIENSEFTELTQVCAISMNMIDKESRRNVPSDSASGAKPVPAAPHPLDGSQFHNVIEEQAWSDAPPTQQEQAPRRARHLPDPEQAKPHPDDPSISVGSA